MERDLTPRQKRFIEEYLKDLNGTQAAIRAGYSAKTAQEQSSRLLSNVMVFQKINKGKKSCTERAQITQDEIMAELAKVARMSLSEIVEYEGVMKARDKIQALIKLGEWLRNESGDHGGDNSGKDTELVDRRLSELFGEFERNKQPRTDVGDQGSV